MVMKKLNQEEKSLRKKENQRKWSNTPWTCQLCDFSAKNNQKWRHQRYCKYTNIDWTEEQKQKMRDTDRKWRHAKFTCSICQKDYTNNYKNVHTLLCKRRHDLME